MQLSILTVILLWVYLPLSVLGLFIPRVWYGPNSELQLSRGQDILPEQYVEFPIDHNRPELGTFMNRYWVNASFYELGGPVFVYDAGAGNANDATPLLTEVGLQSAVMQLARAFHGMGIVLEHRYYGKSIPFTQQFTFNSTLNTNTLTANLTSLKPDQWQYHTLDQAIADLNLFPQILNITHGNVAGAQGLRPQNTPYIVLGGGIGGVRAAAVRLLDKSNIFASWASSAPVQAQVEFSQYFEAIDRAIPMPGCRTDMYTARLITDEVVNGTTTLGDFDAPTMKALIEAAIRGEVNGSALDDGISVATETVLDTPFLQIMRDFSEIFNGFQVDGVSGVNQTCLDLETQQRRVRKPAGDGGLKSVRVFNNKSRNVDKTDVPFLYLETLNRFQTEQYSLLSKTQARQRDNLLRKRLAGDDTDRGKNPSKDDDEDDKQNTMFDSDFSRPQRVASRTSWQYQYCTQFGLYIVSNPLAQETIQSKFVDRKAVQAECDELFTSFNVILPDNPRIDEVLRYNGSRMNPTQTFFTQANDDPWLSAMVASQDNDAPKRQANLTVPGFDERSAESHYFGLLHSNGTHAQDLVIYGDSSVVAKNNFGRALRTFAPALESWLAEFTPEIKAAAAAAGASGNRATRATNGAMSIVDGFPRSLVVVLLAASAFTLS